MNESNHGKRIATITPSAMYVGRSDKVELTVKFQLFEMAA
jgi:hypothetical protein